jgi:dihydroorotate dehydrogenase electron transfer subunit
MAALRVLYNRRITPSYYKLGLSMGTPGRALDLKSLVPGQFVMLKVSDGTDPLLRRPFSVYNLIGPERERVRGGMELLYKVAGRGTEIMSGWEEGRMVDVLGPLGNGFPRPRGKLLMVAGGIGIASFYLLAKKHPASELVFGARSRADAALAKDFRGLVKKLKVTTEDGSVGEKGLVSKLVGKVLKPGTVVYACGPEAMLRAVSEIARKKGVKCLVSMERAMACGMGACLGCAVKMKNGVYKMACSDGPVFKAEDIQW